MNRYPKVIINALAATVACFLALGLSSCTTEETEASLSFSPTSVSVGSTGGSFELTLSTTVSYSVSVSGDWLWPSSGGDELYELSDGEYFCRVPGSAVLEFTADANSSTSARTATIKITAGDLSSTVSVTQAGTDGSGDEDDTEDEDSGDSSDDSGNDSYEVSGTLNGYEYVDLGLSVKWATCNIGADSPEEYGNYYAWGETVTKSSYTSSNSVTYGVSGMSDFSGDTEYDAATANWGSPWRMPTDSELTELRTSCTWTWTTLNDVNGYEVTGTNGNSIFLPAAGFRNSSSLGRAGSYGRYWSSTPDSSGSSYAYYLSFYSSSVNRFSSYRYLGQSVRPVSE